MWLEKYLYFSLCWNPSFLWNAGAVLSSRWSPFSSLLKRAHFKCRSSEISGQPPLVLAWHCMGSWGYCAPCCQPGSWHTESCALLRGIDFIKDFIFESGTGCLQQRKHLWCNQGMVAGDVIQISSSFGTPDLPSLLLWRQPVAVSHHRVCAGWRNPAYPRVNASSGHQVL